MNEITIKNKKYSLVGLPARLIRPQTNRVYFSDIPVGTNFIIIEEHLNDKMPAYDLTGYFLNYPPQSLPNGKFHYTGYIEKGSWELIEVDEVINNLINHSKLNQK